MGTAGDKTVRSNKRSFNNPVPSLSVAFPILPDFHHGPVSVEDGWRSNDPVPPLLRPRHSRLHSVVHLDGHLLLLFHLATVYAGERASVNAEQCEPDVGSCERIAGARMFSDSGRSAFAYGQLPAFADQSGSPTHLLLEVTFSKSDGDPVYCRLVWSGHI